MLPAPFSKAPPKEPNVPKSILHQIKLRKQFGTVQKQPLPNTHRTQKRLKKIKSKIQEFADQISKSISDEERMQKRHNSIRKKNKIMANKTQPNHPQNRSFDTISFNCENKLNELSIRKSIIEGNRKLKILKFNNKNNHESIYFPNLSPTINATTPNTQQLPSIRKLSLDFVQSLSKKTKSTTENSIKLEFPELVASREWSAIYPS